ncbi:MAG TPA: sensor domain-containing diguanylate cyclase [bacterium]
MEHARLEATLSWLVDAASDLAPASSLDDTLDRYLTRLVQWLRADQASIMLVNGEELSLAASVGLDGVVQAGSQVPPGPARDVLQEGRPRILQGTLPSERETPRPDSAIIIPIRTKEHIIGVLNVGKLPGSAEFTDDDLQVLTVVATQLAWVLSNFELMSKMWTLAITDELTGLFNRRYFYLRIQEEIQRSARYDAGFCLGLLDLDGFKELNRLHGHLVGDEVLSQVCGILRKNLRGVDLAARYGGDEIVLLFPETGPEEALRILTRLQTAVHEMVFVGRDGIPVKLGFCAGIAQFPYDGHRSDELIQRADEALLEAKRSGFGRVVVAD